MKVVAYIFAGFVDGLGNPCRNPIWEDLKGKPILLHIIERLRKSERIDRVIPYFHPIGALGDKRASELAKRFNITLYPHYEVKTWEDDTINFRKRIGVQPEDIEVVNPHSPLIDIELIDMLIERFITLTLDCLKIKGALKDFDNLHIWSTSIFYKFSKIDPSAELCRSGRWVSILSLGERPDLFKTELFKPEEIYNKPELNLSVDSFRHLLLMRKIYDRFYKEGEIIDTKDVLRLYEKEPEFFEVLHRDQIEIEVTNDCNLMCIMCPRTSNMKREIGYMDFGLFKKIVDETKSASIHFSGFGEPLLHPQIKEMFAYAKDKGLEVGLWTSGLELTQGLSKQIIEGELVDYIIFGLDAATKETFVKIKGVDAFDKAIGNITRFLELKRELLKDKPKVYGARTPIVGIQITKMKDNDYEIEQFMEKWNFQDKAKVMVNYKTRIEKEPMVNTELWETFYDKFLPVEHAIIGHFNNFCGQIEDRSVVDVTPLKRFPCKQLQAGISILWNGDVILCRQDFEGKYSLGNLKEQYLIDILESEKLKSIWQAHKKGEYDKLPLCKDCKEWYYNLYA